MLKIKNLQARIKNQPILKGLELSVNAGEIHAIMGPNGSGKSTLANILVGRSDYEITAGSVEYEGKDLIQLEPEERSWAGIFLAFQYPVELPGVNNVYLLKSALNAKRQAQGLPPLDAFEFLNMVKEKIKLVKMNESLLQRSVNTGFSGGEKKRNEILQMAVLEPKLMILDETDSGLDIDALKIVAEGVNGLHDDNKAIIVITHYQRLLDYIKPDYVHILQDGRIIKSGGAKLAEELDEKGYDELGQAKAAP